ncbi:hypothetical protein RBH88_03535 [Aminobacterium sp. MB27-C1]|jgi:hypothetical protein|uniref:ubiquitin-conjugating enzyme E2 variant n=1 Tax=Aminobacterium sp. MB27-C1 TaxID=3070661 RepID=UPI0027DE3BF6|nr:hypothetical protein [Aminobacterium sp. MB27-C1]WMI72186.1 hypothetical protein RBH88_03535 [Aminobacterium sp. MB27-C1]
MGKEDRYGLIQFLRDYPKMSIVPSKDVSLLFKLRGRFDFQVQLNEPINGSFMLEILVPINYPQDLPVVKEVERQIPLDGWHHVNSDGSLCLGSPIRLLKKVHDNPNLTGFAENCLVPFLCAISYRFKFGGDFIYGELRHGAEGIIDDYKDLLGLKTKSQVLKTLKLLGMRKKRANKKLCPCGCNRKLGACEFHYKLNDLRKIASRSWFREHFKKLKKEK